MELGRRFLNAPEYMRERASPPQPLTPLREVDASTLLRDAHLSRKRAAAEAVAEEMDGKSRVQQEWEEAVPSGHLDSEVPHSLGSLQQQQDKPVGETHLYSMAFFESLQGKPEPEERRALEAGQGHAEQEEEDAMLDDDHGQDARKFCVGRKRSRGDEEEENDGQAGGEEEPVVEYQESQVLKERQARARLMGRRTQALFAEDPPQVSSVWHASLTGIERERGPEAPVWLGPNQMPRLDGRHVKEQASHLDLDLDLGSQAMQLGTSAGEQQPQHESVSSVEVFATQVQHQALQNFKLCLSQFVFMK